MSTSSLPALTITFRGVAELTPNPRNPRTHSRRQIRQIADSIKGFGFLNPILIDEAGTVVAGHGRLAGAKLLGMPSVPTICAAGLSEAQRRAYVLADNKLAEKAGWDRALLAAELGELAVLLPPLNLDLTLTGFEPAEVDSLFSDLDDGKPDAGDRLPPVEKVAVTRRGDVWLLGAHRLLCGDVRSAEDVDRLMAGERARLTFTDPPYNVPIAGHVQGRGRVRHKEFAFAAGEMSAEEFAAFLRSSLANVARVSHDGAIVFVCMDWRHVGTLDAVGRAVFTEMKNLIVWAKASAGQGSFYRSQHELIAVFKMGTAEHRNSFGLGATGRTRSNVWTYPGANSFHAGRAAELEMHPTVKPLAMVVDALRDTTLRGDTVLDLFAGSGTTLMAAERLGRRAYVMEYEGTYVDVCVRRWQDITRLEAVLEGDGRSWTDIRADRLRSGATAAPMEDPVLEEPAQSLDDGGDGAAWVALCESIQ